MSSAISVHRVSFTAHGSIVGYFGSCLLGICYVTFLVIWVKSAAYLASLVAVIELTCCCPYVHNRAPAIFLDSDGDLQAEIVVEQMRVAELRGRNTKPE